MDFFFHFGWMWVELGGLNTLQYISMTQHYNIGIAQYYISMVQHYNIGIAQYYISMTQHCNIGIAQHYNIDKQILI